MKRVKLLFTLLTCLAVLTTASTTMGLADDKNLKQIRRTIGRIEKNITEMEQRINSLDLELQPDLISAEGLEINPNSLQQILAPDAHGWAANMVRDPSVARVAGKLRLFFGTREDHPGREGIGYVNLDQDGLMSSADKQKLAVKKRYYSIGTPEYVEASADGNPGKLFTTQYYIWRAGEWASYLTFYDLNKTAQGLAISNSRKVLTGSDKEGDWMARGVQVPKLVQREDKLELFFKAQRWPKLEAGTMHTLAQLTKTNGEWTSPEPLFHSETKTGIWPYKIAGFEVVPLSSNTYLFLVQALSPDNKQSYIEALLYQNKKVRWSKKLLTTKEIRPQLKEFGQDNSLRFHHGLELVRLNSTNYLYFPIIATNKKKQRIFRAEINLPAEVSQNVPRP